MSSQPAATAPPQPPQPPPSANTTTTSSGFPKIPQGPHTQQHQQQQSYPQHQHRVQHPASFSYLANGIHKPPQPHMRPQQHHPQNGNLPYHLYDHFPVHQVQRQPSIPTPLAPQTARLGNSPDGEGPRKRIKTTDRPVTLYPQTSQSEYRTAAATAPPVPTHVGTGAAGQNVNNSNSKSAQVLQKGFPLLPFQNPHLSANGLPPSSHPSSGPLRQGGGPPLVRPEGTPLSTSPTTSLPTSMFPSQAHRLLQTTPHAPLQSQTPGTPLSALPSSASFSEDNRQQNQLSQGSVAMPGGLETGGPVVFKQGVNPLSQASLTSGSSVNAQAQRIALMQAHALHAQQQQQASRGYYPQPQPQQHQHYPLPHGQYPFYMPTPSVVKEGVRGASHSSRTPGVNELPLAMHVSAAASGVTSVQVSGNSNSDNLGVTTRAQGPLQSSSTVPPSSYSSYSSSTLADPQSASRAYAGMNSNAQSVEKSLPSINDGGNTVGMSLLTTAPMSNFPHTTQPSPPQTFPSSSISQTTQSTQIPQLPASVPSYITSQTSRPWPGATVLPSTPHPQIAGKLNTRPPHFVHPAMFHQHQQQLQPKKHTMSYPQVVNPIVLSQARFQGHGQDSRSPQGSCSAFEQVQSQLQQQQRVTRSPSTSSRGVAAVISESPGTPAGLIPSQRVAGTPFSDVGPSSSSRSTPFDTERKQAAHSQQQACPQIPGSSASRSVTPEQIPSGAGGTAGSTISAPAADVKTRLTSSPFVQYLKTFLESKGLNFRVPTVQGAPVDLQRVYESVRAEGGIEAVMRGRKWKTIAEAAGMKWGGGTSSALRRNWDKYLQPYETAVREGSIKPFFGAISGVHLGGVPHPPHQQQQQQQLQGMNADQVTAGAGMQHQQPLMATSQVQHQNLMQQGWTASVQVAHTSRAMPIPVAVPMTTPIPSGHLHLPEFQKQNQPSSPLGATTITSTAATASAATEISATGPARQFSSLTSNTPECRPLSSDFPSATQKPPKSSSVDQKQPYNEQQPRRTRILRPSEYAGFNLDEVEETLNASAAGWAQRALRHWKIIGETDAGDVDRRKVLEQRARELGPIDLNRAAMSLKSGLEMEMNDTLNLLLVVSSCRDNVIEFEKAPQLPHALVQLLDSLRQDILSGLGRHTRTTNLESSPGDSFNLAEIFAAETTDAHLEGLMDRAVAGLCILRNASFSEANQRWLALQEQVLELLTSFAGLGLHVMSLADETGYIYRQSFESLRWAFSDAMPQQRRVKSLPDISMTPSTRQFGFDVLENIATVYAGICWSVELSNHATALTVFDVACLFLSRQMWRPYVGQEVGSPNRIVGLTSHTLDILGFGSLVAVAQLTVNDDNRSVISDYIRDIEGRTEEELLSMHLYWRRFVAVLTETIPRSRLPIQVLDENVAQIELSVHCLLNLVSVDGMVDMLLKAPLLRLRCGWPVPKTRDAATAEEPPSPLRSASSPHMPTNSVPRRRAREPFSAVSHTVDAGLSGLLVRLAVFSSTTHIQLDKVQSVIPVLRRAMMCALELAARVYRTLARIRCYEGMPLQGAAEAGSLLEREFAAPRKFGEQTGAVASGLPSALVYPGAAKTTFGMVRSPLKDCFEEGDAGHGNQGQVHGSSSSRASAQTNTKPCGVLDEALQEVGRNRKRFWRVVLGTVMEEHCDKMVKELCWRALMLIDRESGVPCGWDL